MEREWGPCMGLVDRSHPYGWILFIGARGMYQGDSRSVFTRLGLHHQVLRFLLGAGAPMIEGLC